MPTDLVIFAAQHLMTVDAVLAVIVVLGLLVRRRHANIVWWTVTFVLMVGLSFAISRLVGSIYVDPRPFVVGHYRPLLPHTANNGFPSGYATAAAVIVFAVLLLNRRWAIPFIVLALLIDWARVGVGLQHTIDIVGAWVIVALSTVVAFWIGALLSAIFLLDRIPPSWTAERLRLGERNTPGKVPH
jgi:undecaprenyl-diphosphatase